METVDPLMAFRLLKYKIRIMDDHLDKNESHTLPIVYPLVFYHGQDPSVGLLKTMALPKAFIER